jgi:hypothetical protein
MGRTAAPLDRHLSQGPPFSRNFPGTFPLPFLSHLRAQIDKCHDCDMTAAQQRKDDLMNDLMIALGRGNCITCHVCCIDLGIDGDLLLHSHRSHEAHLSPDSVSLKLITEHVVCESFGFRPTSIDLRHYVPAQVKLTIALCIRRRPPYSRCNAFGKDINLIIQVIYETVSRCACCLPASVLR